MCQIYNVLELYLFTNSFFFSFQGRFFWLTQNGKRQPVNLTIKDGETPGLTWGTELNNKASFSDIRNVSFVEDNGKFRLFVKVL